MASRQKPWSGFGLAIQRDSSWTKTKGCWVGLRFFFGIRFAQQSLDDLVGGGGIMPLAQLSAHLLHDEFVGDQFRDRLSKRFGTELRLDDHAGRAGLGEAARVVVLMIIRRRRIGNENGGNLHRGDFGERRSAR